MTESVQALVVYLNKLSQQFGATLLSVEIFTDKSFRINKHDLGTVETIFESDLDIADYDINDLLYIDIPEFLSMVEVQATLSKEDTPS